MRIIPQKKKKKMTRDLCNLMDFISSHGLIIQYNEDMLNLTKHSNNPYEPSSYKIHQIIKVANPLFILF